MGRPATTPASERYQLLFLTEQHRTIAERIVAGQTQVEIAHDLHISEPHLSNIVNSELFKSYIEELRARGAERLALLQDRVTQEATIALDELSKLLHDPKAPVKSRIDVAVKMLEWAGVGKRTHSGGDMPPLAVQINNMGGTMTDEQAHDVLMAWGAHYRRKG